jgi:hypothetical protein
LIGSRFLLSFSADTSQNGYQQALEDFAIAFDPALDRQELSDEGE